MNSLLTGTSVTSHAAVDLKTIAHDVSPVQLTWKNVQKITQVNDDHSTHVTHMLQV